MIRKRNLKSVLRVTSKFSIRIKMPFLELLFWTEIEYVFFSGRDPIINIPCQSFILLFKRQKQNLKSISKGNKKGERGRTIFYLRMKNKQINEINNRKFFFYLSWLHSGKLAISRETLTFLPKFSNKFQNFKNPNKKVVKIL